MAHVPRKRRTTAKSAEGRKNKVQRNSVKATDPQSLMWSFGNSLRGQLGTGRWENSKKMMPVIGLQEDETVLSTASLNHTAVVTSAGSLYTCGANQDSELGRRSSKLGVLRRVVSLDMFKIVDVAVGIGFTVAVTDQGAVFSWGRNQSGQLGVGDRKSHSRPRRVKDLSRSNQRVVHVAAGRAHTIVLGSDGKVFVWGDSMQGQIGHGTFTSSSQPILVSELHRRGIAVTAIAAGDAHSMALTATGRLYSWGSNRFGQLGLGNTQSQVRPQPVRHFQCEELPGSRDERRSASKVVVSWLSAGGSHSLCIAGGHCFSWGKGLAGQLGHANRDSLQCPTRIVPLHECGITMLRGGAQHTIAFSLETQALYIFGGNSSGQLGTSTGSAGCNQPVLYDVSSAVGRLKSAGVFVGGNQTFVIVAPPGDGSDSSSSSSLSSLSHAADAFSNASTAAAGIGNNAAGSLRTTRQRRRSRSDSFGQTVELLSLARVQEFIRELQRARKEEEGDDGDTLRRTQRVLFTSFSSLAVLGSSFRSSRLPPAAIAAATPAAAASAAGIRTGDGHATAAVAGGFTEARQSFEALLALKEPKVTSAIGRSAYRLTATFKECRFDEPRQVHALFVVLANPLLADPAKYHGVLAPLVDALIRVRKSTGALEHFTRLVRHLDAGEAGAVLAMLQAYLTLVFEEKRHSHLVWPAAMALEMLWDVNMKTRQLPIDRFYNAAVSAGTNLEEAYNRWQNQKLLFSACKYPFLLFPDAKRRLLRIEMLSQMVDSVRLVLEQTWQWSGRLPTNVPGLDLTVRRRFLLNDTVRILYRVLTSCPHKLRMPLVVKFEGEEGVDEGGLRKEFFHLVVQQILSPTENPDAFVLTSGGSLWFKGGSSSGERSAAQTKWQQTMMEICGALLGLAAYNGVLVSVPFPRVVYRKLIGLPLGLADLAAVAPDVARGLRQLLAYEADTVEDDFMLFFEATERTHIIAAAAAASSSSSSSSPPLNAGRAVTVELKVGGSGIAVTKENRAEYVELLVRYMLETRVAAQFRPFKRGFLSVVGGRLLPQFQPEELDLLVQGQPAPPDSLRDLRKVTKYTNGFTASSPTVMMFWNVVLGLTTSQQMKLLRFATGSDRVPILGLSAMQFIIQRSAAPASWLPVAHTCFNVLELPEYPTLAVMRTRLLTALEHARGFGIV